MADLEENGSNNEEFGVEKWSLRPDLVDGCSRSGDRVVELLESRTLVLKLHCSLVRCIIDWDPNVIATGPFGPPWGAHVVGPL